MWDEKTVENIAPTNSVRTPYELTVEKLNSDELRRTGPWKTWIRKFLQNLYVKIRWICMWFGVFLPKSRLNWCEFPWKQPVWALFSPYFHVEISDQTKPRRTPTNPDELRRTQLQIKCSRALTVFQSESQKSLHFDQHWVLLQNFKTNKGNPASDGWTLAFWACNCRFCSFWKTPPKTANINQKSMRAWFKWAWLSYDLPRPSLNTCCALMTWDPSRTGLLASSKAACRI